MFQLFLMHIFYIQVNQGKANNGTNEVQLRTGKKDSLVYECLNKVCGVLKGNGGQPSNEADSYTHDVDKGLIGDMFIPPTKELSEQNFYLFWHPRIKG